MPANKKVLIDCTIADMAIQPFLTCCPLWRICTKLYIPLFHFFCLMKLWLVCVCLHIKINFLLWPSIKKSWYPSFKSKSNQIFRSGWKAVGLTRPTWASASTPISATTTLPSCRLTTPSAGTRPSSSPTLSIPQSTILAQENVSFYHPFVCLSVAIYLFVFTYQPFYSSREFWDSLAIF